MKGANRMTETPTLTPTEGSPASAPIVDYWGTDEYSEWYLPDGVQFFRFKIMNEGEKTKFEKMTNQDLIVNRDQSARVRVDPSEQRHSLIKSSVVGWNLYKGGEVVGYSPQLLNKWLEGANPKLVEDLEFAIRMANPWMQSEMTEEVDKEIARLYEVRSQLVEKEAGEAVSATK
jgi:hypothetical protein